MITAFLLGGAGGERCEFRPLEAEAAGMARDFLVSIFRIAETDAQGGKVTARQIVADAEKRIPVEFANQPELRAELLTAIREVKRAIAARIPFAMILEVRGMVEMLRDAIFRLKSMTKPVIAVALPASVSSPYESGPLNFLRQQGQSPSNPFAGDVKAIGCGSVMIALNASGAPAKTRDRPTPSLWFANDAYGLHAAASKIGRRHAQYIFSDRLKRNQPDAITLLGKVNGVAAGSDKRLRDVT